MDKVYSFADILMQQIAKNDLDYKKSKDDFSWEHYNYYDCDGNSFRHSKMDNLCINFNGEESEFQIITNYLEEGPLYFVSSINKLLGRDPVYEIKLVLKEFIKEDSKFQKNIYKVKKDNSLKKIYSTKTDEMDLTDDGKSTVVVCPKELEWHEAAIFFDKKSAINHINKIKKEMIQLVIKQLQIFEHNQDISLFNIIEDYPEYLLG